MAAEPKRRRSFILNTGVTTVAVVFMTFFFLNQSRSAIEEVVETSFSFSSFFVFFFRPSSVLRQENELDDLTTQTFCANYDKISHCVTQN